MPEPVPFSRLEGTLLSLGFQKEVRGDHVTFRHRPTDTILIFPRMRANERVEATRVASIRRQLAARGVINDESFDSLLDTYATAVAAPRVRG